MSYKKEILKWWLSIDPLSDLEQKILFTERSAMETYANDTMYGELVTEYFNRMPFCNLTANKYTITFDDSGTNFINNIFDKHLDSETLVICSNQEHPSLDKRISEHTSVLRLAHETEILNLDIASVEKIIKKYKKVICYVIGTTISSGVITPQQFYVNLKHLFQKENIEHILICDDVHGMFFVPRDYSIFDYILYTAHACINDYDMGVLISKDGEFGKKIYNQGLEYLAMLDVILSRKDKINQFYTVLQSYFGEFLAHPNNTLLNYNTKHLFSIKTDNLLLHTGIKEILDEYEIRLEGANNSTNYILFRNARFIKTPEFLIPGITKLEECLPYLQRDLLG